MKEDDEVSRRFIDSITRRLFILPSRVVDRPT